MVYCLSSSKILNIHMNKSVPFLLKIVLCFAVPAPSCMQAQAEPHTLERRINVLGPEQSGEPRQTHSSVLPCIGSSTILPKCTGFAVSGFFSPAVEIIKSRAFHGSLRMYTSCLLSFPNLPS